MADKKTPKMVKRQREERGKRRIENKARAEIAAKNADDRHGDKVWNVLSSKDERPHVKVFSEEEEKRNFTKKGAFGTLTCPLCGRPGVLVANPHGEKGDVYDDYVMTHRKLRNSFDCDASGVLIRNLFKT